MKHGESGMENAIEIRDTKIKKKFFWYHSVLVRATLCDSVSTLL
jgi:hypothetical protein